MHKCTFCDYQSSRRYNLKVHVENKHNSQTGSGAVQSSQPHSQNEKHSNLQEENIDQLYENIDQWKKAYETLKEQYQKLQQEEKVTTSNDGRPSHVSIQLYDKCCKALTDYMYQCQRFQNEKEQLLYKFCTDWEDLKWERDSYAKEISRRDRCGEGVIHKNFARKLRSRNYWGS